MFSRNNGNIPKILFFNMGLFSLLPLLMLFKYVNKVPALDHSTFQSNTAKLILTPGENFKVCGLAEEIVISVQDVTDLYGYQIQFNFDSNLVIPMVVFDNSFFDTSVPGGSFAFITCGDGNCTVVASKLAPEEPISGDGPLVKIAFETVGGEGGFYDMQLSNVVLSDIDGFQLPVEQPTESLAITVCGFTEIDGIVTLEGRANPINPGLITLIDLDGNFPPQSGQFDGATGQFMLGEIPYIPDTGSNYRIEATHQLYLGNVLETQITSTTINIGQTELLAGDADLNNAIDIVDLACIGANFGNISFKCVGIGGTDINSDGSTNIQDLTLSAANFRKAGFLPW